MAAPTYTWEFAYDLWGTRVPVVATFEAGSNLETKVGTLVNMSSGRVAEAGNSTTSLLGLAAEETAAALTAGDPIKVYLIAPGMVIRGTADADASSLAGFSGKTIDINADGSLDVADTSGGCFSVHRTENGGLLAFVVATEFDLGPVN